VRAVVIDDCTNVSGGFFASVVQCDLAKQGESFTVRMAPNTCRETQKVDNFDTGFPDILVDEVTRPGDHIRCSQEIAVVADGTWLTDPLNHTHNFHFQAQGLN
jgi:hypothetical protein